MRSRRCQNIIVRDRNGEVIAKRFTSDFDRRCNELFRYFPEAYYIETVGYAKTEDEARYDRGRAKGKFRSRNDGRNPRRDLTNW